MSIFIRYSICAINLTLSPRTTENENRRNTNMSISEMEVKARELRQLQALIEVAQAEAEAIKDAIKAAMGDSESVQAGEYRISHGRL